MNQSTSSISLHQIKTSRLEMSYRQCGLADSLPMLLVHGSYASSRWWEPLMGVLPDAILAVALDLRGSGGTQRATTGYYVPQQAEDLEAFVVALGWDDFDLVGHSSGGAIAIEYALTYPGKARTLSLVDTVPLEGVFTPLEMYVVLEQMRSDRALLAQALQALMPTYQGSHPANQQFFEQLVNDAQQMDPTAFTALADALNQWNRFGDGRNLNLPTLLVWGDQDIIIDRDAMTRTLIAIPGAHNLEVLRSIGHSPMIEAPVTLAERLIDFITDDFDDFDEVRRMAAEDNPDTNP